MCISPILISGGQGTKTDAMSTLQKICTEYNKHNFQSHNRNGPVGPHQRKIMDPEQMLQYLSHMTHEGDNGGSAERSGGEIVPMRSEAKSREGALILFQLTP